MKSNYYLRQLEQITFEGKQSPRLKIVSDTAETHDLSLTAECIDSLIYWLKKAKNDVSEQNSKPRELSFDEKIEKYVDEIQKYHDREYEKEYDNLFKKNWHPVFEALNGKRYVKIVRSQYSDRANKKEMFSRSVFCFVDKQTGQILKAASYKKPAKGARGHIDHENKPIDEAQFYRYR